MKTIKIIDLYNLIANEEFDKLPKKVKYCHTEFEYDENEKNYHSEAWWADLLLTGEISKHLNDEIEILEDEKEMPKKLNLYENLQDILNSDDESIVLNAIHDCLVCEKIKINEILDYLESKGK